MNTPGTQQSHCSSQQTGPWRRGGPGTCLSLSRRLRLLWVSWIKVPWLCIVLKQETKVGAGIWCSSGLPIQHSNSVGMSERWGRLREGKMHEEILSNRLSECSECLAYCTRSFYIGHALAVSEPHPRGLQCRRLQSASKLHHPASQERSVTVSTCNFKPPGE